MEISTFQFYVFSTIYVRCLITRDIGPMLIQRWPTVSDSNIKPGLVHCIMFAEVPLLRGHNVTNIV